MITETTAAAGRECRIFRRGDPAFLLIQPAAAERDDDGIAREAELIAAGTDAPFLLAAFPVDDWNGDLSPWPAPAAFGTEAFGGKADRTLEYVLHSLLPAVREGYGLSGDIPAIIGGYSLAGLFALWSVCECTAFAAAAAASPSVWFPGWTGYAGRTDPHARAVYLSLGDREERTGNRTMAAVGDEIRSLERMLDGRLPDGCVLEWNEGNHFREPDRRCARAFLWCMERLADRRENEG